MKLTLNGLVPAAIRLLVGVPCFSRGSWTSVQRKSVQLMQWALARGFLHPGAKAQIEVELLPER